MATTPPPPHWSVATHKGGCGKTALVTMLAAAAAESGERVLVVDMDAQANATRRLRAALPDDPDERQAASLAAVLDKPTRGAARRVIVPCGWGGIYSERIDVAPGHLDLELLAATASRAGSERRLLTALADVVDAYALVLIDCPPNLLSHLIDNAWTASDLLWVPIEPEHDSIEAARRVVARVAADREYLNPDLQVGGFLINRFRQSLSLHQQRSDEAGSIIDAAAVCPWRVPELVTLKNASEMAKPLAELGSEGRGLASVFRDIYTWQRERAKELTA